GRERLHGEERDRLAAEHGLEIGPGRVRPLACPRRVAVHELVEDLRAGVAHPDLVGVGEGEADGERDVLEALPRDVPLEAEIAPRPLDGEEERLESGAKRWVTHVDLRTA